MCIGVVVPPDDLARFTDDGPSPLNVKGNVVAMKTELRKVVPGVLADQLTDASKRGELVNLPDTVDVTGPGTARVGITALRPAQRQDVLQQQDGIHRIQGKLHGGQGQREQRLQGDRHDAQALQSSCDAGLRTQKKPPRGEGLRQLSGNAQAMAAAPPTTSRISWVMAA